MDRFTFIAEMTKALAWPVVALCVAMLARKPVTALIQGLRLQRLKAGSWEADFRQHEREVEQALATLPAIPQAGWPRTVPKADGAPRAAILEAWIELETMLLEAARALPGMPEKVHVEAALSALVKAGRVREATAESLRGLRALRNLAAHAPKEEPLAERVSHFVAMAEAARFNLERDLKRQKPGTES